jgi:cysteine desulfurase/selenocysteine lyase
MLDINKIRADSLFFSESKRKTIGLFWQRATSPKPQVVIDAISKYYQEINANIHRGVHTLSQQHACVWDHQVKFKIISM